MEKLRCYKPIYRPKLKGSLHVMFGWDTHKHTVTGIIGLEDSSPRREVLLVIPAELLSMWGIRLTCVWRAGLAAQGPRPNYRQTITTLLSS